jgi:signal transduction histidine kinase
MGPSPSPNAAPLPAAQQDDVRALREELEKRERQLLVLAEVAARIQGEDDVDAILEAALEAILRGLDLEAAWVFLGDQADRKLRLAAHQGVNPAYLREIETHGLGECLCPEVFSTGHRMVARNTTDCPRMPTIVAGLPEPAAHACIPLVLEGTSRGVLNVAARPGALFSEGELRFLETVGRQICIAMERAAHLKAERVFDQEARALAALNKGIGEALDVDAILRAVGRTALDVLGVDRVAVYLGSDPRHLTVAHLAGLPHPELREGQPLDLAARGASLQRRAIEEQLAFQVDDWQTDGRVNHELARRWDGASAMVFPLVARKVCLGLLMVSRRVPHRWTEDQREVAEALAGQASVTLENARLYENARRAYRELNEAQARIIQSEKLAVVGTFASGLAHEIRNPLNSIALQISILERRVAPLDAPLVSELRELMAVVREEVKRLDNLVGDFLQFSRAGRLQFRRASLDALLDEVVRLLRPAARAGGVGIRRRRSSPALPALPMDGEKIKQVVINLVQNAIEAMPQGGEVVIETALEDGRARLRIQDQGPGLPAGLDVFQLFVTTKARGTGLGLPIAQQIVLEHGGEITAGSAPGGGATFEVSLPLPEAPPPSESP